MGFARASQYWQVYLGLTEGLPESGLLFIPHAKSLADYWGMYAFKRGDALIFSVPESVLNEFKTRLEPLSLTESWSASKLQTLFTDYSERVIGPAYQGWLEPERFRFEAVNNVRLLRVQDQFALLDLKHACPQLDWEHSDIKLEDKNLFGYFLEDRLLTVAKAIYWQEDVINLGVVCHPDYRGKRFAEACLGAVIKGALELNQLVLYQTLLSNTPALKLAEKLGFQSYSESIAIRFKAVFEQ